MSVNIKSVRWKNFLATGNAWTKIDVASSTMTSISGSNGSGKSTFLDAISFGLYNKPFRKINKPQLINSINGRDCIVEIEFEVAGAQYLIRRGIKPAIFEIIKDGTLIDQSAANLDYQDILETQILRMNHRTFCQVAILGSANFVPFMQLSASQRREVVEDLLDIQIFSKMNSVLKQYIQASKDEISSTKSAISQCESTIRLHEKHLSRLLLDSSTRMERAREHVQELQASLSSAISALDSVGQVEDQSDKIQQLVASIAEALSIEARLKTKTKSVEKTISFFETNHHCPTCEQEIDAEFKAGKIHACKETIVELGGGMEKLTSKLDKLTRQKKELESAQAAFAEQQRKTLTLKSEISSLRAEISRAEATLSSLLDGEKETKEEIQMEIVQQKASLESLEEQLARNLRRADVLNVAAFLLKDGGIKAKIIRQYIPVINKLVNKYLAAMDFFIQFEFDENFTETIKSKYREDFSYASFSEGEKARINIALLFAWRAVAKMRNSASTNLLVLDEVFDGALDSVGTDELMGILETFTQGTNAFVITHREALIEKFPHSIQFEKQGNFSVML